MFFSLTLRAGSVTAFEKSHLLLSETKVTTNGKPSTARWYFRSVWAVVYRFWAHLIGAPKLGKPGKKIFVKVDRYFVQILFLFSIPKKCTTYIWNVRHINRSFDSFYSQAVLTLCIDRLANPRIKHQNNIIIFLELALTVYQNSREST